MIEHPIQKVAGVMGWPISHSLSPRLHGYWIKKYDIYACYDPWAVKPEYLERTLRGLVRQCRNEGQEFRGTNLTIPLKEIALDIVDQLDPVARRIGAVNTIVVESGDKFSGRNTDAEGFCNSLLEHVEMSRLKDVDVVIIGAGGAARAVAVGMIDLGAATVRICNRSMERAEQLVDHLGSPAVTVPWKERHEVLAEAGLVVNTTSLGMIGQPDLDLNLQALPKPAIVTDIVYTPLKTGLLLQAEAAGYQTVDGLGMLLHQARAGFKAWYGIDPVVDEGLRQHVLQGLKQGNNK